MGGMRASSSGMAAVLAVAVVALSACAARTDAHSTVAGSSASPSSTPSSPPAGAAGSGRPDDTSVKLCAVAAQAADSFNHAQGSLTNTAPDKCTWNGAGQQVFVTFENKPTPERYYAALLGQYDNPKTTISGHQAAW